MDLMALINQKRKDLSNDKQKTIRPADGRGRYRILPSWREEGGPFWHDFGQHYIKDQMGKIKAVYVCTERTFGKPCGVCDAMLNAQHHVVDDETMKVIKDAKASARVLVNVLHLDGPTPNVPQILELAPSAFNQFLGIVQEWGADVLDLKEGKDIIIEKTGKGLETKYNLQIAAKSAPVDPGVMKSVANLDEYVAQESVEQQRRAIANLNAIAGLLSAPEAAATSTRSAMAAPPADYDDTLTIPGEPDSAAPAPAAKVVKAAVAAESANDADLDDLLASLS